MDCHEARRLLAAGVRPGTRPPERALLGFHLAQCAACRAILDAQAPPDDTLLLALLAQTPPALPAAPPRGFPRRRWLLAMLAIGLLVLGGTGIWLTRQGPAAATTQRVPGGPAAADAPPAPPA